MASVVDERDGDVFKSSAVQNLDNIYKRRYFTRLLLLLCLRAAEVNATETQETSYFKEFETNRKKNSEMLMVLM